MNYVRQFGNAGISIHERTEVFCSSYIPYFKMRHFLFSILVVFLFTAASCDKKENPWNEEEKPIVDLSLNCRNPQEVGGYKYFFRPQHTWVGDPMPFYKNGAYQVFYLDDERPASDQFHPWHLVQTTDASSFIYRGEAIPCGETNEQDIAIGTGSVIKKDNLYYGFYTGHKWNHVSGQPKEAVMLATSSNLVDWEKVSSFKMFANPGYDQNEFRDPFVIYDELRSLYIMLVSTRFNQKAVLAQYTSTDLYNWQIESPFYTDESVFMIECVDLFEMKGKWYFVYSNINDRKVHYRISDSMYGPWETPAVSSLDGVAFYAAKSASDGNERLLFGWCPTRIDDKDQNNYNWGGSLVAHKISVQEGTGLLAVSAPPQLSAVFVKEKAFGVIDQTSGIVKSGNNHELNAANGRQTARFSRVLNPHKISTTVHVDSEAKNFGFVFGACDDLKLVYALHIDMNEGLLKLANLSDWNSTSTTYELLNSVPLVIAGDGIYEIEIIIERSVAVIYVNGQTALTSRIYKMHQNPWMIFSDNGNVTFGDLVVKEAN